MEANLSSSRIRRIAAVAPGLPALLAYQREDLPHDLVAGLSVAAIALPIGVAYADLAGFAPVVGLYASILPLVAYALFGTSCQLVVGPDTATCAMVAAAVAPLAGGDLERYQALSVVLALFAGLLCVVGSFLRLGVLAAFLSKPILIGLLNGVALSIAIGQLGKLFGFPIAAKGIVPPLIEFAGKLGQSHLPTLAVGLGTFAVLLAMPRLLPAWPAVLVAVILAAAASMLLRLEGYGVSTGGSDRVGALVARAPPRPPAGAQLPDPAPGAARLPRRIRPQTSIVGAARCGRPCAPRSAGADEAAPSTAGRGER